MINRRRAALQRPKVQGSKSRAVALLFSFLAAINLSGCGTDSHQEEKEAWETENSSAFQAFRDRNYQQAIASYKRALLIAQKIDPNGEQSAVTETAMATVFITQNDTKTAEQLFRHAAEVLEAKSRREKLSADAATTLCDALRGRADIKHRAGEDEQAEPLYKEALRVIAPYRIPSKERQLRFEYKSVLSALGKDAEAQAVSEQNNQLVDAESLPNAQNQAHAEAKKFVHQGEMALAAHNIQKAKDDLHTGVAYALKCDDPRFRAGIQTRAAMLLFVNNEINDAEQYMLDGLRTLREAHCPDEEIFPHLVALGTIQTRLFKLDDAEKAERLALKIAKAHYDKDGVQVASAEQGLVQVLSMKHQYDEALPMFEHSYQVNRKIMTLTSTPVVMHTCWLANLYWLAGKKNETQGTLDEFIAELNKRPAAERVLPGRLLVDYGNECLRQNQKPEAAMFFNAALKVLKPAPGANVEIQRAQTQLKALQAPAAT